MRCEVCGAPLKAGEKRCARCSDSRSGRKAGSPSGAYGISSTSSRSSAAAATIRQSSPTPEDMERRIVAEARMSREQQLPLPRSDSDLPKMPSSIILEGKYRLLNELGRGSMGTVFLAEDRSLKRKVAVKFLLPELSDSEECCSRFRQEAVAMASIRNENVAQIYAYGMDNGAPYFVMEHLDGETVEDLIDSHNRRGFYIPVDDAVDIMIQAVSGVRAIHKVDAVHRDIKPANIMLTVEPMRAVIMDFGLVRDVQMDDDMRTLAGTPAYIAPELVEGLPGANRSRLTDIYSLGTTFYEIITGSIPFGGETWVEILQKHIAEIPVFPSVRRPGIPEVLDDVILRAMAKDPKERYQDCDEFLDDLLEIQAMPLSHDRRPSMAPPEMKSTSSSPNVRTPSSRHRTHRSSNRAFKSTPSGTRGRLLVADADPEFRSAVHGAAKSAVPGCRVHSATDGSMALELIKTVKPHVVMVDLSLPEVNGFEIVATIRGDSTLDQMKVIVVTTRGGQREASILRSMGVTRFLTKPVDQAALAEILRPLLERPMSISGNPSSPYS